MVNLSPKKTDLLRKSRLFLARAAPAGAREWVAEHPKFKKFIAEAEADIAACTDHNADRAFRGYVTVWFGGFEAYIKQLPARPHNTDTPWADLWHARADAPDMSDLIWERDGDAWFCTFTWPDPRGGKAISFQLRSRGAGDGQTSFISAPEQALCEQVAPTKESHNEIAQAIVRVRSVFPGAVVSAVNGIDLVPDFLS
jgi:hypothetical protein